MLTVFLCDDNKRTLNQYAQLIEMVARKHGLEVTVSSFGSGEELIFHSSDAPNQADIIYLDILMRDLNGMDTAKQLRELGCESEIIFLTTSEDYVYDAFDIAAVQYLLKSETSQDKFEQVFLRAASLVQKKATDMFLCESGTVQNVIPIKEIAYFEIWKRIVTVHFHKNEKADFYSTLEQIEEQLQGKGFIRVHRSYMVNVNFISKFQKNSIILKTGENIPIGVTYVKNARHIFADYISRANIHDFR